MNCLLHSYIYGLIEGPFYVLFLNEKIVNDLSDSMIGLIVVAIFIVAIVFFFRGVLCSWIHSKFGCKKEQSQEGSNVE